MNLRTEKIGCKMSASVTKMALCVFLLSVCALAGCADRSIVITDAKMATGIDEKFMPVAVTDVFPAGSTTVFCWFQWKNSQKNIRVTASWNFLTDSIHILDYEFVIPRKEGSGGVLLSMPNGKTLPIGSYKVDLLIDTHKLRSLTFKVE